MRSTLFLIIALTWFSITGKAQDQLRPNEYHYHYFNGLDVYFVAENADPLITMNITFRMGVFAEPDSLHGTSYMFYKTLLKRLSDWAAPNRITVDGTYQHDYTSYILQFPPQQMAFVLNGLYEQLSMPIKADTTLTAPGDAMERKVNPMLSPFYIECQQRLWQSYYPRTTNTIDSLPTDTAAINNMIAQLFGADNALVVIRGNISNRSLYQQMLNTLGGWKSCRHSYFLENPVPYPQELRLSNQFVQTDSTNTNFAYTFLYHGPASWLDRDNYLLAPLYQQTLQLASGAKPFMDSSHIKQVDLICNNGRYAGELIGKLVTDTTRPDSGYYNYQQFFTLAGQGKIFTQANLDSAKAILKAKFDADLKDPIKSTKLLSSFWLYTSAREYSQYKEKLDNTTYKQLLEFNHKFLEGRPYTAGLEISQTQLKQLGIDSFFTTTNKSADYRFVFVKNNAQLADSTQDSLIVSLAQFIKINPHIRVMVNGVASKDELLHQTDNQALDFLKQHPGFKITPTTLVPLLKVRLDVDRALTIVKRLIELGVPDVQVTGTGKVVPKDSMQPGPDQQVYCTLDYY